MIELRLEFAAATARMVAEDKDDMRRFKELSDTEKLVFLDTQIAVWAEEQVLNPVAAAKVFRKLSSHREAPAACRCKQCAPLKNYRPKVASAEKPASGRTHGSPAYVRQPAGYRH
jgi:hypothetical protein